MKSSTNKFGRRALALLLALTMCFSMVMSAAAETTVNTKELKCTNPDVHNDAGEHTAACYEYYVLTCTEPTGENDPNFHQHGDECYTTEQGELTCALDVVDPHQHTDTCYTFSPTSECIAAREAATVENPHECTEACYSKEMLCTLVETDGHAHTVECYESKKTLTCEKAVNPGHEHGDECWAWVTNVPDSDTSAWEVIPYESKLAATPGINYKTLWCSADHAHTSECYEDRDSADVIADVNNALQSGDKNVTLNLQDNFILEEKDPHHGTPNAAIGVVGSGAQLTITGQGTIKAMEAGFAVIRIVGGKVVIDGEVTITGGNNANDNGGGVYLKGGELELKNGTISDNKAQKGGGVYVSGGGKFTMTGGTIENNTAVTGEKYGSAATSGGAYGADDYKGVGGGVFVDAFTDKASRFIMESGAITGNTADEGGGVYVSKFKGDTYAGTGDTTEDAANFLMKGGAVTKNEARYAEGGGIYIKGAARIQAGLIAGNITRATGDLGGGGVYIENTGALHMVNAIVTNNTANGLGGGFAACVHGRTTILGGKDNTGAVIYGNNAKGENHIDPNINANIDQWDDKHSNWGKTDLPNHANDIFSANVYGQKTGQGAQYNPGLYMSNPTLNGIHAAWTGTMITHKDDCNLRKYYSWGDREKRYCTCDRSTVNFDNTTESIYAPDVVGMDTFLSDEDKAALAGIINSGAQGFVLITGNHSDMHGGGIANNGLLTIGETPTTTEESRILSDDVAITVNKTWTATNDEAYTSSLPVYAVLSGNGWSSGEVAVSQNAPATITIPATVLADNVTKDGNTTLTFTLTEVNKGEAGVGYDSNSYPVSVTVSRVTDNSEKDVGGVLTISKVITYSVVAVDGGEITLSNTYHRRGSLTLSKKIVNTTDWDANNKKYTFQVTSEALKNDDAESQPYYNYYTGDGVLSVPVFGASTVTINGLPSGSYTVTELKDGVAIDESKYSWTISNGNQNSAVIGAGNWDSNVEITNTFDYYRGSLTINKVITGAASTSETKDKVFTFTVTGPEHVSGTFDGITFEKGNATVAITGDGQKTISGLPAGTYRVHEENAELGGYTWTVKGNDQSVEVTEGGNAAVTVTNTYDVPFIPTAKTKSITVNKAWAGDEDAGIQRPASVQVQLMVNGAASGGPVTLSAANDWRHTWSGLAESAVLSVKEIDVPAGYVAVTSQNGSTIVITNTYKATPTPTPTPTPGPSQEPTPTPEPDEEIPDDDVPLGPGPEEPDEEIPDDDVPLGPGPEEPDEEIPDDDVPLGPGPEPTPEPDEELPDPDVPTGPAEPEEEDIPDEEVPLANTPKTGDDISLWYLLTALSAAGLVFLAVTGRMRKQAGK